MNGHDFERGVITALKNLGLNVRQSSRYEDRCQLFDFLVINDESPEKNITVQITLFINNHVKLAQFAETYDKRGCRRSLYVQVKHVSANDRYLVRETASIITEVINGHLQEEDVLIGLNIFIRGQLTSESEIFDIHEEVAELKQKEENLIAETRQTCDVANGFVTEWQWGGRGIFLSMDDGPLVFTPSAIRTTNSRIALRENIVDRTEALEAKALIRSFEGKKMVKLVLF